ncbi:TPM domain-containing protein [Biformimicrobium ophioploci]|uniref:TPM domain-containing protein n=1 Tax=Biformimicrobium ophioploci TaxID=3036711 RepID=A0ABQ6LZQ2_9GAMM|nr:TPM domain-containing protein [Microbulbifer sp. NKW57]GMG87573.1 hypothetical protein MNKW57_18940 [Microbulbifer sp. NKW57]
MSQPTVRAIATTLLAVLLFFSGTALAEPTFPALTGRVVDSAGMLDPATAASLEQQLAQHETATSNQLVVATVPDLQGYAIEQYANLLARHWQIGQKDVDNGALLLVAQAERKVRIEVGYGLEGSLTDALSALIIHNDILPRFRVGDFSGGISAGVNGIIAAIKDEYTAPATRKPSEDRIPPIVWIFLIIVLLQLFSGPRGPSNRRYRRGRNGGYYGPIIIPGGGGFGGGGFGGGGFGGGGGGFGGGGASGGW